MERKPDLKVWIEAVYGVERAKGKNKLREKSLLSTFIISKYAKIPWGLQS